MKIAVLAIGKAKGAEAEWAGEYLKRLGSTVEVREFAAAKNMPPEKTQQAEARLLLNAISPKTFAVLCDERGKDMGSREFAAKLAEWQQRGDIAFIIGGADGVTDEVRKRADFTIGFGRLTWPHRLVRVMLLEQIYRAKQIIAGHPYHRD